MDLNNVNFVTPDDSPITISAEKFTLLTNFNQDIQFYVSGTGEVVINLPLLADIKQTGNLFIILTSSTATVTLNVNEADSGITSGGSLSSSISITGTYNYVYVSGTNDSVWVVTNSNGNGVSNQSTLFNQKVTLSSSQLLVGNTTPIDILPAPGAGKIIQPMYTLGSLRYNSAPYGTNTELVLYYDGADPDNNALTANSVLLAATATTKGYFGGGTGVNPSIDAVFANAKIKAKIRTGNPTGGNSPLDLYLTYIIINV